jgi:hypothetical protein
MEIKINLTKVYLVLLIIVIVMTGAGVVVYGFGGNQPSVVGHSASELDWTGFVFPAEIKVQLKGDTGATGAQGPAGAQGAAGAAGSAGTGGGLVSGGLYGYCTDIGRDRCKNTIAPAYCAGTPVESCYCKSGYTKIILETGKYGTGTYTCLKN